MGKTLEARSKGKTTDALKRLMQLAPKTAVLLENGKERTVPIEQVMCGMEFAVRPGETIAVCLRMERVSLTRAPQGACAIPGVLKSRR